MTFSYMAGTHQDVHPYLDECHQNVRTVGLLTRSWSEAPQKIEIAKKNIII